MDHPAIRPIRALVTGASGFVGSRLCRALVARGFEVTAVTIPDCSMAELQSVLGRIRVFVHDGTTDSLLKCVKETNPEIVFHLAALVLGEHSVAEVQPLIVSNVLFGTQLLEAMHRNSSKHFINTGTYWQHYKSDSYQPVNLYAATKQAFEDVLQYYVEGTPLQAITLKLFDNYGPKDPRPKLLNMLKRAAEGDQVVNLSPGEQLLDLVYVDDVVEAYLIAATRLMSGKVSVHESYAVNTRRRLSLKSLVELAGRAWNKPVRVNWGGRPYRPREVMMPWTGTDWLPEWEPKIDLEAGLPQLMDPTR